MYNNATLLKKMNSFYNFTVTRVAQNVDFANVFQKMERFYNFNLPGVIVSGNAKHLVVDSLLNFHVQMFPTFSSTLQQYP